MSRIKCVQFQGNRWCALYSHCILHGPQVDSPLKVCSFCWSLYIFSAPSRAPDFVNAHNTSSTSLALIWSQVPKQYYQGEPIGYNISYNPDNLERDLRFVMVNHTTHTATLTDLDVYTKYAINVSAVSSGGVGPAKSTFASTGANTILFLSYLLTGLRL